MLSAQLKQLIDQAIAGNAEAFSTFQIEKRQQFSNDLRQTKDRLIYFANQQEETIKHFLQTPDIASCSSKLLYFIIIIIQKNNDFSQMQILETLLERAAIKCMDHPELCNVSSIHIASLYFNTFIKKDIKRSAYRQSLLLLADDVEGTISYLQAEELALFQNTDAQSKNRILTKLKQSADKKNELACFRLAIRLSEEQDLSVLDKENDLHKQIIRNLKRAADHGFAAAYDHLAEIYLIQSSNDADTIAVNRQNAITFLMHGIDARNPACMYRLATLYFQYYPHDLDKIKEANLLIKYAAKEFKYAQAIVLNEQIEARKPKAEISKSSNNLLSNGSTDNKNGSRKRVSRIHEQKVRFDIPKKKASIVKTVSTYVETTSSVMTGLSHTPKPTVIISTQDASTSDYKRDAVVSDNFLFDDGELNDNSIFVKDEPSLGQLNDFDGHLDDEKLFNWTFG